jgi:hypothetical protein
VRCEFTRKMRQPEGYVPTIKKGSRRSSTTTNTTKPAGKFGSMTTTTSGLSTRQRLDEGDSAEETEKADVKTKAGLTAIRRSSPAT